MKKIMKPPKILYENQEEVFEEAKKYLLKIINYDCVSEAYVWASFAEGKFGVYKSLYRGQEASDIDLVIK